MKLIKVFLGIFVKSDDPAVLDLKSAGEIGLGYLTFQFKLEFKSG
jgi:hypothetical protein